MWTGSSFIILNFDTSHLATYWRFLNGNSSHFCTCLCGIAQGQALADKLRKLRQLPWRCFRSVKRRVRQVQITMPVGGVTVKCADEPPATSHDTSRIQVLSCHAETLLAWSLKMKVFLYLVLDLASPCTWAVLCVAKTLSVILLAPLWKAQRERERERLLLKCQHIWCTPIRCSRCACAFGFLLRLLRRTWAAPWEQPSHEMLVKCFVINKSFRCDAPQGSDCYATVAYIACHFKIGDRQVGTRWSAKWRCWVAGWSYCNYLQSTSSQYHMDELDVRLQEHFEGFEGWTGEDSWTAGLTWNEHLWTVFPAKNCSVAASCGCRCVSLCIFLQINALLTARPIADFLSC